MWHLLQFAKPLLSCAGVLGALLWGTGGSWSLGSVICRRPSICYRAASVEDWTQWCQRTPSRYPWRNVENHILYISRINLTPIKVNGKAAIYLSGNKIRSRVAGIRAWSRKRHWKLRRWLWVVTWTFFPLSRWLKQPCRCLFLPSLLHWPQSLYILYKLLFWMENRQFW